MSEEVTFPQSAAQAIATAWPREREKLAAALHFCAADPPRFRMGTLGSSEPDAALIEHVKARMQRALTENRRAPQAAAASVCRSVVALRLAEYALTDLHNPEGPEIEEQLTAFLGLSLRQTLYEQLDGLIDPKERTAVAGRCVKPALVETLAVRHAAGASLDALRKHMSAWTLRVCPRSASEANSRLAYRDSVVPERVVPNAVVEGRPRYGAAVGRFEDLVQKVQAMTDAVWSLDETWRAARARRQVPSIVTIHRHALAEVAKQSLEQSEAELAFEQYVAGLQRRELERAGVSLIPGTAPRENDDLGFSERAAEMDRRIHAVDDARRAGLIRSTADAHQLALERCGPLSDSVADEARYLEAFAEARGYPA